MSGNTSPTPPPQRPTAFTATHHARLPTDRRGVSFLAPQKPPLTCYRTSLPLCNMLVGGGTPSDPERETRSPPTRRHASQSTTFPRLTGIMSMDTKTLRAVGLRLMRENGKSLQRTSARGQIYEMQNGETVRMRTQVDRVLMTNADRATTHDATIDIEAQDWLLIVMPEVARTHGPVAAYLVPSAVAAEAVRRGHQAWLDSMPETHGENTRWHLWFDESISTAPQSGGFASRWSKYRLPG